MVYCGTKATVPWQGYVFVTSPKSCFSSGGLKRVGGVQATKSDSGASYPLPAQTCNAKPGIGDMANFKRTDDGCAAMAAAMLAPLVAPAHA